MRNSKQILVALALAAAAAFSANVANVANAQTPSPGMQVVAAPSSGSPLVAVRLLFAVGSIHDPAGKEGLAALTAQMIGQSGTAKRSYSQLVEALYPMAAAIDSNTDREVTIRETVETVAQLVGFAGELIVCRDIVCDHSSNTVQSWRIASCSSSCSEPPATSASALPPRPFVAGTTSSASSASRPR